MRAYVDEVLDYWGDDYVDAGNRGTDLSGERLSEGTGGWINSRYRSGAGPGSRRGLDVMGVCSADAGGSGGGGGSSGS